MENAVFYRDVSGNEYRVARVNWGCGTAYTIMKLRPDGTYEAPDGGTPFWFKKAECEFMLKYFAVAKELTRADTEEE